MTGQDGQRKVRVLEAHTLADCPDWESCWWQPHRLAAGLPETDQSSSGSAPRDGLVGSDEARRAPNRVRGTVGGRSDVIIVGARMTEDGFAEAVRAEAAAEADKAVEELATELAEERTLVQAHIAEAVAEERQRIIAEFAKAARVARKADGETDAQRLFEVAKRVEGGYPVGGSSTTETVTRLLRFVAGFISAAGSVPVATPPTMDDATLLAKHAAYISRTVTASYPAGLDPELVMRRRVGKIFVESGELGDAIEGWTGENPRKGVYATREDVIKELIDCASASLCAIEYMTGDAGLSVGMVTRQVTGNAQRLSESIEDHCGQPAYPDSVAEPSVGTGTPAEAVSGRLVRGGWYPSEYEAKPSLIERWAARCARAVLQTASPYIESMCHWTQGRGNARAETHEEFHYGSPCPYESMAIVLRGESDPRDVDCDHGGSPGVTVCRYCAPDEARDEDECTRARCVQIAATASDVYCDITGGALSYPTYDAQTILTHASDETNKLVESETAELRAEVARYRAAIEKADRLLGSGLAYVKTGHDAPTQELVEWITDPVRTVLAAALGDGE